MVPAQPSPYVTMGISDYETLMLPLLQIAGEANGQEVPLVVAVEQLAVQFKLTTEDRHELLPGGGTFKFSSRVSWARTYLQKAGLLEATKRGHFRVTDRGRAVLKNKPVRIDGSPLSQFEEFREFQGRKKDRRTDKVEIQAPGSAETPIESLATQYERLREALASEVLERVKNAALSSSNDSSSCYWSEWDTGAHSRTLVKLSARAKMGESME